MTTATNTKNLRKYKSRFSLIVEQILAFPSSTNLVGEVKNLPPNFKRIIIIIIIIIIIYLFTVDKKCFT